MQDLHEVTGASQGAGPGYILKQSTGALRPHSGSAAEEAFSSYDGLLPGPSDPMMHTSMVAHIQQTPPQTGQFEMPPVV